MNDYDHLAEWYDTYVQVDQDLSYFRSVAAGYSSVLELMSGTGRVSVSLAESVSGSVTCIDRSLSMLRVLRRKTADQSHIRVVCADVCALPLRSGFDLVIVPFNSLAEVIERDDRRLLMAEVWRALIPGGRFVCTLHNPVVRLRTLDGRQRELGSFELPDGGRLEVSVTGTVGTKSGVATSDQIFRRFNRKGKLLEERRQSVRFGMVARSEVELMAERQGFRMVELVGDYDGAEFDYENSPFMIWQFQRPEAEGS